MLKKKINNIYLIFFFIFFVFFLVVFLFFLSKYLIDVSLQNIFSTNFLIYIIFFTLLGSLIMLFSLYNRQFFINEQPSVLNSIYKKDIFLSVFICAVPVLLFLIGGMFFMGFSYFIIALISYIFYIR